MSNYRNRVQKLENGSGGGMHVVIRGADETDAQVQARIAAEMASGRVKLAATVLVFDAEDAAVL